jgi:hypothetical protein
MLTHRARVAVAATLALALAPRAWAGPVEALRAIPAGGAWSSEARGVLLSLYDASADGALGETAEIEAVPCPVWRALDDAVRRDWSGVGLRKVYGFDPGFRYMGGLLGVPESQADAARTALAACGLGLPPGAGAANATPETPARPGLSGVAATLAALPSGPPEVWDAAARALLLAHFDGDHDGALSASEATAVGCDVWATIDDAARTSPQGAGLRAVYGVDPAFVWVGAALGLHPDARVPLRVHLSACQIEAESAAPLPVVRAAAEVAAAIRELPGGGSDAWDAAVRPILLDAYDADHSGALDAPAEVTAIPCPVWVAIDDGVRVSWTLGLRRIYGLAPDYTFVGPALGLTEAVRPHADAAAEACGLAMEPRTSFDPSELRFGDDARAAEIVATLAPLEVVPAAPLLLVRARDADGDGLLDQPREVDGTSCALLSQIDGRLREATGAGFIGWIGASPRDLGAAEAWGLPGITPDMRPRLTRRARRCGLV